MYLISFIAVILTIVLSSTEAWVWGKSSVFLYFMDFPTLILLLIICVPFLISTGLIKDFNNAFRIVLSRKKKTTLIELKRAVEAVSLTIKSLLCTGILISVMSLFMMLHTLDTPESIGPKISVCILSIIYVCVFILILLPLRSTLNLRIIEYMQEDNAESEEKTGK